MSTRSRRARRAAAVLTLAGLAVACSSSSSDAPEKDVTRYECAPGSRPVRSACVPNAFDTVIIPSLSRLRMIDTDPNGVRYVRASLLVSLRDPATTIEAARALAARFGGEVIGAIPFAAFYQLSFADTPDAAALAAKAQAIAADPAVAGTTRDELLPSTTLDARPATTDLEKIGPSTTWDESHGLLLDQPVGSNGKVPLERIRLTAAWDAIHAANPPLRPVTVGILDGIVNRKWFPLLSFSGANDLRVFGTKPSDSYEGNHGTSVAALIGAPNDGSGTTGILGGLSCLEYDLAPMAVVEEDTGETPPPTPRGNDLRTDALFYGMVYAVQAGARVVNASLGTSYLAGERRYNLARNVRLVAGAAPDTLFVFAAGNEGLDAAFAFPCSAARDDEDVKAPNIMCVAATSADDDKPAVWFHPTMPTTQVGATNRNVAVKAANLAAPGDRLLSQLANGKLTMFSGTSGATPLVSGAAGLLFAILPGLDGEGAKRILVDTGDPIDAALSGKRLNVGSAVARALDLANRLRPETTGKGECREPDGPDAGGGDPKGVCVAPDPSHLQCWWDTDTECSFTRTSKTGVETTDTCNGNVRFPWNDDQSISELTLQMFDAQTNGVFVLALPKESVAFTVTGTRPSGSVTIHVESTTKSLGVIGDSLGGGEPIRSVDLTVQWTPTIITGNWSVLANTGGKAQGTFKGTYHPRP